jgi:hypothetical protein
MSIAPVSRPIAISHLHTFDANMMEHIAFKGSRPFYKQENLRHLAWNARRSIHARSQTRVDNFAQHEKRQGALYCSEKILHFRLQLMGPTAPQVVARGHHDALLRRIGVAEWVAHAVHEAETVCHDLVERSLSVCTCHLVRARAFWKIKAFLH